MFRYDTARAAMSGLLCFYEEPDQMDSTVNRIVVSLNRAQEQRSTSAQQWGTVSHAVFSG
jgi:hypothetical protein